MTNRTDNFNRGDTSSAIGTPSDGGSNWVQLSGTWGIASNQGYESAATSQSACVLESSVNTVDVQVTLATVGLSGGVISRAADNNNYILAEYNQFTQIRLFKNVAAAFTQLGSTVTSSFSNGDVIKLSSDGSDQHVYSQNGTPLITATDSAGSTNTKHGIRTHNANDVRFDTFSITDNSGGGGGGATGVGNLCLLGAGA
jgi:hypothetical protein